MKAYQDLKMKQVMAEISKYIQEMPPYKVYHSPKGDNLYMIPFLSVNGMN